jgi:DNA (cytosine-5)-methyltransferase 1
MAMGIGENGRVGFSFTDIFSGIGGFRLALESLGGKCVLSSEIERCAREAYFENFGEWPAGDITAIPTESIPDHDIMSAGFPCPAFSASGKGMGYEDARGKLFFEIPRIASIRKPSVLFLENVARFASSTKPWLSHAKAALEDAGYRVFWQVIDAGLYGARTSRKRTYLVCFRNDMGITSFDFPKPSYEPVRLADVLLPDAQTGSCVIRPRRIIFDDGAVARANANPALRPISVGRIGEAKPASQGCRIYSDQGLAVTLMANGGGMGAKTGLYLVRGRVRRLHPEECKLVMGFPSSYAIPSSISVEQARRLFGNSVVVPVVRLIAERILETLQGAVPTHSHVSNAFSGLSGESAPHASL